MNNLYIYIKNAYVENVIKYGMKLSEFANKILNINDSTKHGIEAYQLIYHLKILSYIMTIIILA